ncbi:MAG: hypothetical protein JST82_02070 [Bacteroidetes bacterium]|nr:hypothetical protein [Bacteroidota bacterium]
MILLTERTQALQECPALARYMHDWQQAEYEELQEELSAEDLEDFKQKTDDVNVTSYQNQLIGQLVYKVDADNIYDYIQQLPEAFFRFSELMKWKELSFLLLYKVAWQKQQNDYPPVKMELQHLRSIGVDDNYKDAIKATGTELIRLLRSVFWLGRCNASLPYIHFAATGSNTAIYMCKFGFLHFYCYDEKEKQKIEVAASESGLQLFAEQTSDFLEGGIIMGRETLP